MFHNILLRGRIETHLAHFSHTRLTYAFSRKNDVYPIPVWFVKVIDLVEFLFKICLMLFVIVAKPAPCSLVGLLHAEYPVHADLHPLRMTVAPILVPHHRSICASPYAFAAASLHLLAEKIEVQPGMHRAYFCRIIIHPVMALGKKID